MIERSDEGGPAISGWTIYNRPRDYPAHYVVRMWTASDGGVIMGKVAALCGSLDEARAQIPPDAIYLGRQPDDDPVIVETWI